MTAARSSGGLDAFAADIAQRCRRVAEVHGGRVNGAWSTGEQLAVALVLRDEPHLAAMNYTSAEAAASLRDRMARPPADIHAWLDAIRTELGLPVGRLDPPVEG